MNMKGIEDWADRQASELRRDGKTVEFDENFTYFLERALEELADESPISL